MMVCALKCPKCAKSDTPVKMSQQCSTNVFEVVFPLNIYKIKKKVVEKNNIVSFVECIMQHFGQKEDQRTVYK